MNSPHHSSQMAAPVSSSAVAHSPCGHFIAMATRAVKLNMMHYHWSDITVSGCIQVQTIPGTHIPGSILYDIVQSIYHSSFDSE